MGKIGKVVVCGMKGVGKTAILEQVIYGTITEKTELYPTIEDIYVANIETDKGNKEKVRFYDTAGIEFCQTATANGHISQQLPRYYIALADGYIFVYSSDKPESLDVLMTLKRDIDKNKDKKEVIIIVLGNYGSEKINSKFDEIETKATFWCNREKIRHFRVNAMQRSSLYDPFVYMANKLNVPLNKGAFTPLSMGRKMLKDSM